MRTSLVAALSECVDHRKRRNARRFLQGLSADELQYIAEFLGACILDSPGPRECSRKQLAECIAEFECRRRQNSSCANRPRPLLDQDHKMILLLEYLCRSGLTQYSIAARVRRSAC